MIQSTEQKIVDAAIVSRRSVRAFLPDPVAREDIEAILSVASQAPSGGNTQPWQVYVLSGAIKQRLSAALIEAYLDPEKAKLHTEEYHYYPRLWKAPYIDRRRKIGWELYSLLGIVRENKSGMQAQHARNFAFFDAPVGLIFTIDRILELGSWLDYGMFLQNVMIAARARKLDTCPQAAFTQFHRIISKELHLPDNEQVVCGMSLGYADASKIENALLTERVSVSGFARFLD